jgi:site-specific DNA-methyltransferase (adenine-specific)
MIELNKIHQGDCIELMNQVDDKSVDMILCDLPYGVTARNQWDIIIPFDKLWGQYKRIIKDNGVIVLTATEPFASMLILSNKEMFRYDLIWDKKAVTGFLNAKRMPLRRHENILIFYKSLPKYNPIKTKGKLQKKCTKAKQTTNYNDASNRPEPYLSDEYYPTSILEISNSRVKDGHPTQKPLELFEYLIKTFTDEGDLVIDNCIGSGTTAIACVNTNRNFIGIELSQEYFKVAEERLSKLKAMGVKQEAMQSEARHSSQA